MYVMSKVNRVTQLGQIFLFVLVNNDKAKNEIAVSSYHTYVLCKSHLQFPPFGNFLNEKVALQN